MAETTEELTPLKKKLDDFGSFLSKVCRLCSSCHSYLPSHVITPHQCLLPITPTRGVLVRCAAYKND